MAVNKYQEYNDYIAKNKAIIDSSYEKDDELEASIQIKIDNAMQHSGVSHSREEFLSNYLLSSILAVASSKRVTMGYKTNYLMNFSVKNGISEGASYNYIAIFRSFYNAGISFLSEQELKYLNSHNYLSLSENLIKLLTGLFGDGYFVAVNNLRDAQNIIEKVLILRKIDSFSDKQIEQFFKYYCDIHFPTQSKYKLLKSLEAKKRKLELEHLDDNQTAIINPDVAELDKRIKGLKNEIDSNYAEYTKLLGEYPSVEAKRAFFRNTFGSIGKKFQKLHDSFAQEETIILNCHGHIRSELYLIQSNIDFFMTASISFKKAAENQKLLFELKKVVKLLEDKIHFILDKYIDADSHLLMCDPEYILIKNRLHALMKIVSPNKKSRPSTVNKELFDEIRVLNDSVEYMQSRYKAKTQKAYYENIQGILDIINSIPSSIKSVYFSQLADDKVVLGYNSIKSKIASAGEQDELEQQYISSVFKKYLELTEKNLLDGTFFSNIYDVPLEELSSILTYIIQRFADLLVKERSKLETIQIILNSNSNIIEGESYSKMQIEKAFSLLADMELTDSAFKKLIRAKI